MNKLPTGTPGPVAPSATVLIGRLTTTRVLSYEMWKLLSPEKAGTRSPATLLKTGKPWRGSRGLSESPSAVREGEPPLPLTRMFAPVARTQAYTFLKPAGPVWLGT